MSHQLRRDHRSNVLGDYESELPLKPRYPVTGDCIVRGVKTVQSRTGTLDLGLDDGRVGRVLHFGEYSLSNTLHT